MTTTGKRPCTCGHCRLCELWAGNRDYRRLWNGHGQANGSAAGAGPAPCAHRGGETGERRECPTCSGRVEVKLLACSVHGACTLAKPVDGVKCCAGCPDRQAPAALARPVVRNLLYHVYPLSGSSWRWNVEQLRKRERLFNGRRLVAVVTDHRTDDPRQVEVALGGLADELLVLPNVPELREVQTFEPLFNRVQSHHASHVTFYAHAMGVTRGNHPTKQRWAEILYETLDYWPRVEELLDQFPLVGSFKKVGRGWPAHESMSDWHYSGSFFWFRNADIFGQPDWRGIDRFWSGIETAPSHFAPVEDAGTLFWEAPVPVLNLYQPRYFGGVVLRAWERWKRDNAHYRKEW